MSVFRERKYRKMEVKKKKKKKRGQYREGGTGGMKRVFGVIHLKTNEEKLRIFQGTFYSGVIHLKLLLACPLARDCTTD